MFYLFFFFVKSQLRVKKYYLTLSETPDFRFLQTDKSSQTTISNLIDMAESSQNY